MMCMGQFVWKCYEGVLPMAAGFAIYGLGAMIMLAA